jgi:hypothetical protein
MFNFEKESSNSKKAIKLLGWQKFNGKIYNSGFPVICNEKYLLEFGRDSIDLRKKLGKNCYDFFRPTQNFEHLQFVIDHLMSNQKIKEIKSFKKDSDNKWYSSIIVFNNKILLNNDIGDESEESSIFNLILKFYEGKETRK